MEFSGLIVKYRANRPLTERERLLQLRQQQRLNVEPHYELSVVKLNSTYLESVDKWFAWKGTITAFAMIVFAMFVGTLGACWRGTKDRRRLQLPLHMPWEVGAFA